MPLLKGRSLKTFSSNVREFHKGKTYKRTARKYGKKAADKEAVAVAYAQKRRSSR